MARTNSIKDELLVLEKIQIKYEFDGFEERNNFLHINFFRFEVNFHWKIIVDLCIEFD
jgi:hypothetical protein